MSFGQGYGDIPFGDLISSRGICTYTGKMIVTWSFEADGSGEYSISHEHSTKCEPTCTPTPMQGGSLWNMGSVDAGMAGSMTLNLKLCCDPCTVQSPARPGTGDWVRGGNKFRGSNSGPDFIQNIRNAVFSAGGTGQISPAELIIIRRLILNHRYNTSPTSCNSGPQGGVSCS